MASLHFRDVPYIFRILGRSLQGSIGVFGVHVLGPRFVEHDLIMMHGCVELAKASKEGVWHACENWPNFLKDWLKAGQAGPTSCERKELDGDPLKSNGMMAVQLLEGLGSSKTHAFKYFGRGSYCKESKWL